MAKAKIPPFEKSLQELDALVKEMEKGELSLEDSLKKFERGIHLSRECQQALQSAQQRISVLTQENDELLLQDYQDESQ